MHTHSNGISIHYDIHGPSHAPVLVFSHSLGASLAIWRPQIEAFSSAYRLLLYDTRGHGSSTLGAPPITVDTLARDLLGLLDTLAIDRIHFCGISMGGILGQWLGIHAPERLHSLTLANTAQKIGTAESWNTRITTVERDGLGPTIPGTMERWFTSGFRAAHPEIIAATEATLRHTDPAGYIACCAAIRDADFRETARQITTPTLLIAGRHDPSTPSTDLQALHASIPGSQYVELEAAHLSSLDAAPAFNAALSTFLAQLPANEK